METQLDGIEVKAEMFDYRSYIFERSRRKIPAGFSRKAKINSDIVPRTSCIDTMFFENCIEK